MIEKIAAAILALAFSFLAIILYLGISSNYVQQQQVEELETRIAAIENFLVAIFPENIVETLK